MDRSDKLAGTIRILPLTITLIFALILVLYMVLQSRDKAEILISHLQDDYISDQKQLMRSLVDQINLHIQYQTAAYQQTLSLKINERLDTAFEIINEIYRENSPLPKEKVLPIMAAALRKISYSGGRGYYFIYSGDGEGIMVPVRPENEGKKCLDLQDSNGVYYVRDMLKKARSNDRSLLSWQFYKPGGEPDRAYEKVGAAVWFAPYGIMIGTGEYVGNIKEELQDKVRRWIKEVYASSFDHVFIFDSTGRNITDSVKGHEGHSMSELGCFGDDHELNYDYVAGLIGHGNFVKFRCRGYEVPKEAITYVRAVPAWGWVVGSVDNMSQMDSSLAGKIMSIRKQNTFDLGLLVLGCLALVGVVAWITFYLSRRISAFVYERLTFDELTGLPNHRYFSMQLQSVMKARRALVLVNLDVDDFSIINELFSRKVGDQFLKEISKRLQGLAVSTTQISRIGSDEFLIYFLVSGEDPQREMQEKALLVRELFDHPFYIKGEAIEIRCTIGVVHSSDEVKTGTELIRRASIVLFRTKAEGKNRWSCFNSDIEKTLQRDKAIANAFSQAMENNEITVAYQAQIVARTGALYGVEALARWISLELGFVSPTEFIGIAEKNGFIFALGLHIFRQACVDILDFIPNGSGPVNVSINISPKQLLHADFIESIQRIVEEVGIDPKRVTLEITENLLTSDVDAVKPILDRLNDLGFEISLDDFGTGASSLSYISRLPIVELKIDRSFVDDIPSSYQSASLVKSIIAIGGSNNMRVVAEGVETEEHVNWLKREGCDLLQGYYFSKPVTIEALREKYGG
ncbi:MAG: EAL domain-containing protein [Desulforhopalus sp.]|nr:EAL domain-containing protein [Desulforhopalus sp.]